MLNSFLKYRLTFYDGEEGGEGGEGGEPGAGNDTEKKFTQKDLSGYLAKELDKNTKKLKAQNQELAQQLEQFKQSAQLTQEQRDDLETRIESLQSTFMTKEETTKREVEKQKKQYDEQLGMTKAEAKRWRDHYENAEIERSIGDAAIEHKAKSAKQIAALLKPLTKMEEQLGPDGKPNGRFAPVVLLEDTNEKGDTVELKLSPSAAVKLLSEKEEHGNLFLANLNSGVGGGKSTGKQGKYDVTKMSGADYIKARKENPDALYSGV